MLPWSPTFLRAGGDTSLIGLLLYLIEMMPLLKRGGGPLLSSLAADAAPDRSLQISSLESTDGAKLFFVISDFSLGLEDLSPSGETYRLTRILFTVLFEVEETIEERGITGPLMTLSGSWSWPLLT